jgi:hypothetical protein
MSSIFDPNALLDATLDQPTEKRPPLPVGDYTAIIGEVSAATWQSSKDAGKSGVKWNVPLTVQIPAEVKESLQLSVDTITLTDSIMLDLTPQGAIDNSIGKNSRLRLYREALDMNKPGDSFSARRMQGQVILIRIEHREYQGNLMENVGKVAHA